jgi:serine/threonine protein kinase
LFVAFHPFVRFGTQNKSTTTTVVTRRIAAVNTDSTCINSSLCSFPTSYHINPKELGHGHYGVVRKCQNRTTKEWFAIKSIRKSKVGKIEVLKREIDILKEVDHPNIIRLKDVFEDKKYLHLITELCTGGELFDRIIEKTNSKEGHFSEQDAAKLIRDICDAIAYCHDVKQIVHRDLKPENFLYATKDDDAPIKIIDFGLSRHDTQNFGVMKTKVGTPYYVAPEVLKREYTKSCDVWSIGVIAYILLCGYPPFYGDSDNEIFESVRVGRYEFPSPEWDDISEDAKDFIKCLLKLNPAERFVRILFTLTPLMRFNCIIVSHSRDAACPLLGAQIDGSPSHETQVDRFTTWRSSQSSCVCILCVESRQHISAFHGYAKAQKGGLVGYC